MRRRGFLAALLLVGAFLCPAGAQERSGMLRVCLTTLPPEAIHVEVAGSYTLGADGAALSYGEVLHVRPGAKGLSLESSRGTKAEGKTITLRRHIAPGENGLRIREARIPANLFPGDLELTAGQAGVEAVLHLYIEDYLLGVVPYEMDDGFPPAALEAQAVAARSYALGKMGLGMRRYDLVDTTADQVYCGTPSQLARAKEAVEASAGLVGIVDGGLMPGYYSASNGGQIENEVNAWGGKGRASALRDDPYDLANPASATRSVFFHRGGRTDREELTELLRSKAAAQAGKKTVKLQRILSVSLEDPKFGADSRVYRTVRVRLRTAEAGEVELTLDYFAEVEPLAGLSINLTENEVLSVEQTDEGFRLVARRMGHGVGLSQRGAEQMAKAGMGLKEILGFYYPQVRLERYDLSRSILGALGEPQSAQEQALGSARVLASPENPLGSVLLRAAPENSAAIVTKVDAGAGLTLLRELQDWALVQRGTLTGYCERALLRTAVAEEAPQDGERPARISLPDPSFSLNLRAAPSLGAQIIGNLRDGDLVSLLADLGDWRCVRFGETVGFADARYIVPEGGQPPSAMPMIEAGMEARVTAQEGTDLLADAKATAFVYVHLPQGTALRIAGAPTQGYLPVALGGIAGYVLQGTVHLTAPAAQSPSTPEPVQTAREEKALVHAPSGLMLRASGRTDAPVLAVMPDGARLTVLSREGAFARVRYGDLEGYASSEYLTFEHGNAAIPQARALATDEGQADRSQGPATILPEEGADLLDAPSMDADKITHLACGMRVQRMGASLGGYTPVRLGALSGYVEDAALVPQGTATPAPQASAQPARAMVLSDNGLNLRLAPKAGSSVLFVLPLGTVVDVLGEAENGFLRVRWGSYEGYVSGSYVRRLEE